MLSILLAKPLSAQETTAELDQRTRLGPVTLFMYGRVGVGTSLQPALALGRNLNLRGLGAMGGWLEEADYLEPGIRFHILDPEAAGREENGEENGGPGVDVVLRAALASETGSFIGSQATLDDDLLLGMPEAYLTVRDLFRRDLGAWVGARFYRGPDVHIIDHHFFNDLSGQGFGLSYRASELAFLFVSPSDREEGPVYRYELDIAGEAVERRRQRMIVAAQNRWRRAAGGMFHLLGELHRIPHVRADHLLVGENGVDGDGEANGNGGDGSGGIGGLPNGTLPADGGWAIGLRHRAELGGPRQGSFNDLSLRYGRGIANGGDDGMSRTHLTYGPPDPETGRYDDAWSVSLVEHVLLNLSERYSLNGYGILTFSRGGAGGSPRSPGIGGDSIFNRKRDAVLGFRGTWYARDAMHLLHEVHLQTRRDGVQATAGALKVSIVPTLVPTGARSPWARPHLRLIYTLAGYNRFARDNLFSPYLEAAGPRRTGQFLGVRAEWWF